MWHERLMVSSPRGLVMVRVSSEGCESLRSIRGLHFRRKDFSILYREIGRWLIRGVCLPRDGNAAGGFSFEALHGRFLGGLGSVVAVRIGCNAPQPQGEHIKLDTRAERSARASLQRGSLVRFGYTLGHLE